MEDLKFTLHKCVFTTGTEGTLKLTNITVDSKTLENILLKQIVVLVVVVHLVVTNIIRITHRGHGMQDSNSKVTISGLVQILTLMVYKVVL